MSAKELRQKYTRSFAGMQRYSRVSAWMVVAGYVFQILAAIAVGHVLMAQGLSPLVGLGVAGLMIFIGTRLRGLNNIVHECSHATFSAVRQDNSVIGKLCASLILKSFRDYRDEHLSHHAHLGDYDHDLDLQGIKDLRLHDPLSPKVLLRHMVNPLLGRHLPYYLGMNLSSRDGRFFQVFKLALLLSVTLFSFAFPMTGLVFVIVPYVLVFSALNYWADCLDHAGLVAHEDDLDASRNILAPRVLRWLFFPRNDCFHLVHHLFPHVPARHLEATHMTLAEDRVYRSRSNAVRSSDLPGSPYPEVIAAE